MTIEGRVPGPARSDARRTAGFLALTLALFVVLTAVMTWPQVLRMSDGVHDPGDPLMVTWVLGWVAHQLPRAPAHLFDANIFYPERNVIVTAVPNAPGALAPALKLISDAGVNIEYAYGGGSEGSPTATIVLGVEDAERAAAAAGV